MDAQRIQQMCFHLPLTLSLFFPPKFCHFYNLNSDAILPTRAEKRGDGKPCPACLDLTSLRCIISDRWKPSLPCGSTSCACLQTFASSYKMYKTCEMCVKKPPAWPPRPHLVAAASERRRRHALTVCWWNVKHRLPTTRRFLRSLWEV